MKNIIDYFQEIKDPRIDRTKKHLLIDIMGITLCSVLAGADGWDNIKLFGESRSEWLRTFLTLENGIPSADTFRRVISKIDPLSFQKSFSAWVNDITKKIDGVVAIDGKTIRNNRLNKPVHMVSAWCAYNDGLCIANVATEEKSNEITAIPSLLELLDIEGCIVTIDAMGCQKNIAKIIVEEKKADYCLAVKGNHPILFKDLQQHFSRCNGEKTDGMSLKITEEENRGREEIRIGYSSSNIKSIPSLKEWPSTASVGLVISHKTKDDIISVECRYFISSAKLSAKRLLKTVRSHWGIENKLHWVLDVSFCEDGNSIAKGHGQTNLATIRKIALNMMKEEPTKMSIKQKIFKASLSQEFMTKVLKI